MHEFILNCFKALKSFWHFMKIVCVFCILMLLLFWIQNLTKANWEWMGFITPFLKSLLDVANNIYSISFNLWGAVFELKYISAIVILFALYLCMNLLIILTGILEGVYRSTHFICKKTEEVVMNKDLKEKVKTHEKKIMQYTVIIKTRIKPKYNHREITVDLDAQNKYMNEFLTEKLNVKFEAFADGYLYIFNDFDHIDKVLDVLFKVLHSTTPLDYAICIQSGDAGKKNLAQLKKLAGLEHFGKITMAADTSYRYRFNETHRYQTSQIGIFQYEDKTLEIHEFKEFVV